jgi:hypothetical protein
MPWDCPAQDIHETIAQASASLASAPLAELRAEWVRHHPQMILPSGLPRDLLIRSILWNIQERAEGGHSPAIQRQLENLAAQLAKSGDLDIEREVRLKPGTRLIREWHGQTYRVEVTSDGYSMDDRNYASLSHVARAITGTRWSGPRFFGLKQRRLAGGNSFV